ncbi:MAG: biotin/lipoyl-binding protein, partial [Gammaproteobacteria bacterium]|nr:biotin/lipoyl-binding protein [Gammaproteobacteria bacterium]
MTRMIVKYTWSLGFLLLMLGVASAEEANLQWARATTLSSVVNGVVAELKVKPGQRVKKGQVLLRLQQEVFISRLHAAESLL